VIKSLEFSLSAEQTFDGNRLKFACNCVWLLKCLLLSERL